MWEALRCSGKRKRRRGREEEEEKRNKQGVTEGTEVREESRKEVRLFYVGGVTEAVSHVR